MKIISYSYPHSSFLSVEKDLAIITSKMLQNQRLLKLLYYPTSHDALRKPDLTQDQIINMFPNKNTLYPNNVDTAIKWEPFIPTNSYPVALDRNTTNASLGQSSATPEFKVYLVIKFDGFSPNATNPYYRNSLITFDIICPKECWILENAELRVYKIAAELDTLFNDKHLSGIGTLQFYGASTQNYSNLLSGLILNYQSIHGDDDRKNLDNKVEQISIDESFLNLFQSEDRLREANES